MSARYGKSQAVAAVAALIALIGSAPYVALQLKAVAPTVLMVVDSFERGAADAGHALDLFYLVVSLLLAAFAMAFGTRRINPKEHQDGLILAIAVELIVKLVAFLAVGAFVVWRLNGGIGALTAIAQSNPRIAAVIQTPPDPAVWVVTTLLSAFAIVLLPRQFHVAVVENHDQRGIRTAAWLFPAYLVLINLFVAPLAIAGLKVFRDGSINRDLTVLALPLNAGAHGLALLTMVGGLSAATGMVVVESVALAITISNDLVMPLVLRRRGARRGRGRGRHRRAGAVGPPGRDPRRSGAWLRLRAHGRRSGPGVDRPAVVRRGGADRARLSRRPLLAPRDGAGRDRRHDRRRARLVLPAAAALDPARDGALGLSRARPAGDRMAEPGRARRVRAQSRWWAAWSCRSRANVAAFVAFSLTRQPSALERAQASAFAGVGAGGKPQAFRLWRSSTTAGELEAAVARYLGAARARRAFSSFHARARSVYDPALEASAQLIRHAEFLLSPAIGASTSRQVLSLLLAAAHGVRRIGAQAHRRGFGGDPVEPRSIAACARPRAPGHHASLTPTSR